MTTAQAAPDQAISPVSSYRDLLDPIPNAFAKLKADDEATQATRKIPAQNSRKSRCKWVIIITTTIIIMRELG
jgi:hypothetical protein